MQTFLRENLKYLRKKHQIGQIELANRFNLTIQTISGWERGINTPKVEVLCELSDMYKVSIDDLLKKDLAGASFSPAQAHSIHDKSQTYIKALEATIRLRCPELAKELGLI